MTATTKLNPEGRGAVQSSYEDGVLTHRNAAGLVIFTVDPITRKVTFPSGTELSQADTVVTGAATQALTAAQSGRTFIGLVDAVFTLPAASAALQGIWYRFITGALSSGTGLSISPAAADNIFGLALTAVDDKDLINTGATDVVGDSVEVMCDGTNWHARNADGTWAKEA